LTNYTTSMRRAGFTALDVAHEGSDNLIDRLVVHGDAPVLAAAVRAHLEAGADHVCVQVRSKTGDIVPALREIAAELRLPFSG